MKRVLLVLLVVSLGTNLFLIPRWLRRTHQHEAETKLHFYKDISYKEGHDHFVKQLEKNYPEINPANKYFIVYRWDSLNYDFIYRDQMKALDSMASRFGKYTFHYVFATEMEEAPSRAFLKRNADDYNNVKMLFGMDDFISGLHSNPDMELPNVLLSKRKEGSSPNSTDPFKKTNLYLIMDAEGKLLFANKNKYAVLKDSTFLNQLNRLLPDKDPVILN